LFFDAAARLALDRFFGALAFSGERPRLAFFRRSAAAPRLQVSFALRLSFVFLRRVTPDARPVLAVFCLADAR
jgi:hypothetical protein